MVEKKLEATIPVYLCLHLLTIGRRKQCQNRLLLFLRWILKVETSPWQTARVQHKYKGSNGLSLKVHSRNQDPEDHMNINSTITFASYSCYGSCQPVEALPGFCCFGLDAPLRPTCLTNFQAVGITIHHHTSALNKTPHQHLQSIVNSTIWDSQAASQARCML